MTQFPFGEYEYTSGCVSVPPYSHGVVDGGASHASQFNAVDDGSESPSSAAGC